MRDRLIAVAAALSLALTLGAQAPLESGLDRSTFDPAVRPGDDFFRHVNGAWIARTEIPADRANYGTFVELSERAENDLREIIEAARRAPGAASGPNAQLIGDLFASFTNEARLNELGAAPLRPKLAEIAAVQSTSELAALVGRLSRVGIEGPVFVDVEADAANPEQVAVYLSQGGTALPDRDYYLNDEARFADIREKYRQYLEKIFTLVDRPNAAADAATVLQLETDLARAQWTRVESRDAVKTFNKYAVARVIEEMPGFDWAAWGRAQGLDRATEWVISEPSFFKSFATMVPERPLDAWKAWLTAQIITHYSPFLSQPFDDAAFDFFGRTLSGQEEQRERWKRGVQFLNGSVGEALGQLYVDKHFPPAAKARMEAMITNLVEAYRQSITTLDWMTPATRKEALEKLSRFRSKIGYPNRWRDYSSLEVSTGDLVGNADRTAELETAYQVSKIGKPTDREEWLMTPQTVNAYYNPVKNEIVFPAAILQPPFFNVRADDAVNYGAIGAVIGHEIGHGFDDQGRRFDGDGRLRDWWSPEDETEFGKRAARLIEQFNQFSPVPGVNVNGQLTVGENIGDLGGLSIAYKAWRLSLAGKPAPVIDDLTGDQRFFMGWAQIWRAKARESYLRRQVLADPHAWAEFRVNGPVSNIDAFYDAFNVPPGARLYRAPRTA